MINLDTWPEGSRLILPRRQLAMGGPHRPPSPERIEAPGGAPCCRVKAQNDSGGELVRAARAWLA